MITIAEKINASIPSVKKIIEKRDETGLLELAGTQAEAGADFIDINVGTGIGNGLEERIDLALRALLDNPSTWISVTS